MIATNQDTSIASAGHDMQPVGDIDKIQEIIAKLHDAIIEGDLQPGTELPSEKELAASLHVSRFSLREALRVARVQGLIEISRGRKPRVCKPSAAAAAQMISLTLRRSNNTLLDLADARLVLETHVAAEAAVRASGEDVERLQKTIDIASAHPDDAAIRIAQDLEFHSILAEATGNVVFEVLLGALAGLLREELKKNYRQNAGQGNHITILNAVRRRDSAAAAAAMREHLLFSKSVLQENLDRERSLA